MVASHGTTLDVTVVVGGFGAANFRDATVAVAAVVGELGHVGARTKLRGVAMGVVLRVGQFGVGARDQAIRLVVTNEVLLMQYI